MRTVALLVLSAIFGGWQAQDPSDLNFAHTMKWIRDFTTMHGVAKERGKIAQEHKMLSAGGCDVRVTHVFLYPGTSSHSIKLLTPSSASRTWTLNRSILKRSITKAIRSSESALIRARTIEQTIELADGEKTTMDISRDYLTWILASPQIGSARLSYTRPAFAVANRPRYEAA